MHFYVLARVLKTYGIEMISSHVFSGKSAESSMGFIAFISAVRTSNEALPGVLGIQGEGLFIFRDLGRRVIYFQGFGEKALLFGVSGSRGLRKNILGSWGERSFFFQGAGSKDGGGGGGGSVIQ